MLNIGELAHAQFVDIVNNHYPDYYRAGSYIPKQGESVKPENDIHQEFNAPGDWQSPVPIYFLAVQPGNQFSFALTKRTQRIDDEFMTLAREWLNGALTHLGAGAKTNAGYRYFAVDNKEVVDKKGKPAALNSKNHLTLEAELELVTPAFLAGANPLDANLAKDECDLRSATLRGHLRWWWRTMHAGYLSTQELARLEAAIWDDSMSAERWRWN